MPAALVSGTATQLTIRLAATIRWVTIRAAPSQTEMPAVNRCEDASLMMPSRNNSVEIGSTSRRLADWKRMARQSLTRERFRGRPWVRRDTEHGDRDGR